MKVFSYIVIAIVAIAIIAGFFIIGSPLEARKVMADNIRLQNLQQIDSEIQNYLRSKSILPAKLVDLNNDVYNFRVPQDPETSTDYAYTPNSKKPAGSKVFYEICAEFNRPSQANGLTSRYVSPYGNPSDIWTHESGHVCFARTIDKDLLNPLVTF